MHRILLANRGRIRELKVKKAAIILELRAKLLRFSDQWT